MHVSNNTMLYVVIINSGHLITLFFSLEYLSLVQWASKGTMEVYDYSNEIVQTKQMSSFT